MTTTNNFLSVSESEDNLIANVFNGGEHVFCSQDMEKENKADAIQWIEEDELCALVSEIHGGIIGYVHKDHIDEITSVLNLRIIALNK